MDVFLNEVSLSKRDDVDIDGIIHFLRENLTVLNDRRIRVYANFSLLKAWVDYWGIGLQLKNALYNTLKFVEERENNSGRFYYHYFRHQDFGLSIGDNISDSSVANATNKILSGHVTAILNIPVSYFCSRPYLPILKSSHDSKLKEKLANIPCFNSVKKIIYYFLLHEQVKPLLNDNEKFDNFSEEYYSFIDEFDFHTWKPKVFGADGILKKEISFPATSYEFIKSELSAWKIAKGNTGDNIAEYKRLGNLVLELNGYSKNIKLSKHYKREIYEAGRGNSKLLVSLDLENGAFEVIDNGGTHIGVYGYDGHYEKHYEDQNDINTHSLIDIPIHMFLFN